MVDMALLQTISNLAGALGVLAASAYYIWNIQNNNKQRRNEVVRTIIDRYSSYELMKVYMSAMEITYDNYDDFHEKYEVKDRETLAKLNTVWAYHDRLGYLLKEGYVSADTMFDLGGYGSQYFWEKFEPLDVEWKRRLGENYMRYVRHLSIEMMRVKKRREPSFVVPEQFSKYM